jgi:nicotinate-nucleotide adenylyltransferase
MGGTFDPPHLGHLVAASEAAHHFELDRVVFVPTGQPWQKKKYSDPEHRFLMTSLGAASHPAFAVSRVEVDRRGPTYTADTMSSMRDFYGDKVDFFFIIGSDSAAYLHTWQRLEELRDLTEMIVVSRPGFDMSAIDAGPSAPELHLMDIPLLDISSTGIRTRVREGRPIDFLVPRDVIAYIRSEGLYAAETEVVDA